MALNKIQMQIIKQLSREHELEPDAYIQQFSMNYLGKEIQGLTALSEEDADAWITKVYLQSLEQ